MISHEFKKLEWQVNKNTSKDSPKNPSQNPPMDAYADIEVGDKYNVRVGVRGSVNPGDELIRSLKNGDAYNHVDIELAVMDRKTGEAKMLRGHSHKIDPRRIDSGKRDVQIDDAVTHFVEKVGSERAVIVTEEQNAQMDRDQQTKNRVAHRLNASHRTPIQKRGHHRPAPKGSKGID